MFSMNVLESPAQFYTVEKVGPAADTLSISTDPYVRDVLPETKPTAKNEAKTKKKSVFGLPLPSFLTAKLGNKPPTSNNAQGKESYETARFTLPQCLRQPSFEPS